MQTPRTSILAAFACSSLAALASSEPQAAQGRSTQPQCVVVGVPTDVPPSSMLDGPLTIIPVFNPNVTAAQQAVIQQAISDWTNVVVDAGLIANPFTIVFQNGALGGNQLALATTSYNPSTGVISTSTITIDNDGSSTFFVDPTPALDEEFAAGQCILPACSNTDLLTVMRHEIGHALGWTGGFAQTPNPLVSGLISGLTFDPSRLNIAMDPAQTTHSSGTAFPGDLMNPTLPGGTRRAISLYPSASLPARAINHDLIAMFVDASAGLSPTGSADFPWPTLSLAVTASPSGTPLLMIPGTYDEATPLTIDTPHVIDTTGGVVIVK